MGGYKKLYGLQVEGPSGREFQIEMHKIFFFFF